MDTSALLAQATFFQGLTPQSRMALAKLCRPRELRKNAVLFREGDRGGAMFLLASGSIQLHKTAPNGEEIVIKVVTPGESFAEVVLFEADRYPVTAVALATSRVYEFLRQDIQQLLGDSDYRRDFIAMLMRKQRYLAEKIRQLTAHDVETRLIAFLREQYGARDLMQATIPKKAIAAAINTTPETLSRLIARLKRQQKIVWTGRTIRFPAGYWQRHPPAR